MNKCKDCKHNKNVSCLICIKDKTYYIGIDLGKGDDKSEIKIKRYRDKSE